MRRFSFVFLVGGLLLFPASAQAQGPVRLSSVQVQLWPEYDQPSMLVIYDFQLPDQVQLPVAVSIRFPKDANLMAVASQAAGENLLNTDYTGPTVAGDWQMITIEVQSVATYHVEYYEPLSFSGMLRKFSYAWPGDHAVDDLNVAVRLPVDATDVQAEPAMESVSSSDGTPYLRQDFGAMQSGQQLTLNLTYSKATNDLTASQTDLQPSKPLGSDTPGRVMLSNYAPYVAGMLGLLLIAGGGLYLWQSKRSRSPARERRHRSSGQAGAGSDSDIYCHQCGTRAQPGDRFCRVCGTRLRLPD
jgi:hypothetical protein